MNCSILFARAAKFGLTGLALALSSLAASAQSDQEIRCMQLEQELANDWQDDSGNDSAQIESEIQRVERQYRQAEAQAERGGCYENFFIFGRGLVRTPRCLRMHDQIEDSRRQLARLQQQRQAGGRGGGNRRRDRLMEALARNGCGQQYQQQQQARREPRGFFEELFGGYEPDPIPRRDGWTTSQIDPSMPYRTLCVRECDGYYYPISYSIMPSSFASQRAQCQTQCAAPADLYVYPNPGGQVEQAVSLDGKAYMDHTNAFKYRKSLVKGCSCKAAEFNPAEIEADGAEKKADSSPVPAPAAVQPKQADAPAPSDGDITGSITPALPDLPSPDAFAATDALPAEAPANVSAPPVKRGDVVQAAPKPIQAAPVNASVAQKGSEAPPRR